VVNLEVVLTLPMSISYLTVDDPLRHADHRVLVHAVTLGDVTQQFHLAWTIHGPVQRTKPPTSVLKIILDTPCRVDMTDHRVYYKIILNSQCYRVYNYV